MSDDFVEYREVVGFPGYRVGSDGTLWSRLSRNGIGPMREVWRKLKPGNSYGYHLYGLHLNGRRKTRLVHALVLEAFVGPKPEGMESCHNDGNRGNNCLANLRWDTRKANHDDQRSHGTRIRGDRHPAHKIKESDYARIREIIRSGTRGPTSLALEYGVSTQTIWKIAGPFRSMAERQGKRSGS